MIMYGHALRTVALWLAALLVTQVGMAGQAHAGRMFLDWTSNTATASLMGYSATASHSTPSLVTTLSITATNPVFVDRYDDAIDTLNFTFGSFASGSITSALTFSSALPAGSRLVVMDVDVETDQMMLTTGGSPLVLIEQLATQSTGSVWFPTYSGNTLTPTAILGQNSNIEATVFDLSGLHGINLVISRGSQSFASGVVVGVAINIPEPASAMLLTLGVPMLLRRRGRAG